jgi:tight adherence protein C
MNAPAFMIILYGSFFMTFYSIFNIKTDRKFAIQQRLKIIGSQVSKKQPEDELSRPFKERIIKPIIDNIGKALMRFAPREMITNIEKKIVMAGRPYNWEIKNWLAVQAFLILGLPIITLFLYMKINASRETLFLVVSATVGIGVLLPNMLLNSKIRKRQSVVLKTLPDIMDLITVSVEAGLTFDSAMSKVVEKMPGTLAREFEIVLQEIKIGKSKKEALYQMADRIGVQDLRSFIGAVIQADQLGVSLGRVLRIQSEQIRLNRKQRIQEKAMRAPIKMLIPMVVFIFPTIFIVLLGPVVINLLDVFLAK